mgnify:CR=1 FL=1
MIYFVQLQAKEDWNVSNRTRSPASHSLLNTALVPRESPLNNIQWVLQAHSAYIHMAGAIVHNWHWTGSLFAELSIT